MATTHIIKAVAVRNGRKTFCRAGMVFSVVGTPVDRDEISDTDWKRLEDEPMLHIREARDEEKAVSAVRPEPLEDDAAEALRLQIDEAIRSLGPADFGTNGSPNLPALRKAAPGIADVITSEHRDAAWERMVADGFTAPAAS